MVANLVHSNRANRDSAFLPMCRIKNMSMAKYKVIAAVLIEFEVEAETPDEAEMLADGVMEGKVLLLEDAKHRGTTYAVCD